MEYYLSNNDLNKTSLYLKYRIELISNRKIKIIPLGDGIAEEKEEECLHELSNLLDWIKKASDMGYEQVSLVFEKKP
jgi:hypothetical protein|tara:strand:+ start:299 stop:529 length:231 start_codon:yes stop_codon:yes gene_type:complete